MVLGFLIRHESEQKTDYNYNAFVLGQLATIKSNKHKSFSFLVTSKKHIICANIICIDMHDKTQNKLVTILYI